MDGVIKYNQHTLIVPDNPTIPYVQGDGIGPEIWRYSKPVIDKAVALCYPQRRINWLEVFAGEKAMAKYNTLLPNETLASFKHYLVGIKGPLTTPIGEGHRSLNVALRQTLDLYVCLRPIRWFPGIASPLLHPEKVTMTIFRENTEDIYAGIEWEQGSAETLKLRQFLEQELQVKNIRFPQDSAFGIKPVSYSGSCRLIKAAIEYALKHHCPSVTLVHKGNIMKFTEGAFKNWGYELAEKNYPEHVFTMRQYHHLLQSEGKNHADDALAYAKQQQKLIINDVITDAFLQNSLLYPENYSVIATLNLNGDYISDQLAAMVGGVGISPGANINYQTGHAIFESTHGTAPDLVGQDSANPCSLLLSAVMMLEYLNWHEAAKRINQALEATFSAGYATKDLARFMYNGQSLSTSQFCQRLIHYMELN